jgi:hypothetical protein
MHLFHLASLLFEDGLKLLPHRFLREFSPFLGKTCSVVVFQSPSNAHLNAHLQAWSSLQHADDADDDDVFSHPFLCFHAGVKKDDDAGGAGGDDGDASSSLPSHLGKEHLPHRPVLKSQGKCSTEEPATYHIFWSSLHGL